jgi:regulator of sirC expression with transglutaminase-like and TPR domain
MTRQEAQDAIFAAGLATDDAFPLIDAALACALHERQNRRLDGARSLVEEAAARLEVRLAREVPAVAMAMTIAGDLRMRGDAVTYDHPDNADIIAVCERRKGLPVALGVIYIEVARRAGLMARGLDFPGHFLLRVETDEGPIVVDPFNGGEIVAPSELARRALRAGITSTAANRLDLLMATVTERAVLTRLQNNILTRAHQAGDYASAERAALRRALLNPDDHRFWLDVSVARELQGALAGALQALDQAQDLDRGAKLIALAARERLRSKLN